MSVDGTNLTALPGGPDLATLDSNTRSAIAHNGTELLSNWSVFWAMASLSGNAVLQRSGADEFPCDGSLSPARISPLICLADMLVALISIAYGLWHGMGIRRSCALYIFNMRRSKPKLKPVINSPTFPDLVIFCLAAFSASKIFAASGLNHKVIVFAAIYIAAPIVYAIIKITAENATAHSDVRDFIAAGHGNTLPQVADMLWCAAYACQLTRLVQVGQSLSVHPQLSGSNAFSTNIALGCIIAAAAAMTLLGTRHYFGWHRPLLNWARKDWKLSAVSPFAISTLTGIPDSPDAIARWRLTLFVPLAVISSCAVIFWTVTVFTDALRCLSKALGAPSTLPISDLASDSLQPAEPSQSVAQSHDASLEEDNAPHVRYFYDSRCCLALWVALRRSRSCTSDVGWYFRRLMTRAVRSD